MAYTFSTINSGSDSSSTYTANINIGPTISPFIIVASAIQNGFTVNSPTLTVGGISLNLVAQDSVNNPLLVIFSGIATGLSGTQSFVLPNGGPFTTRTLCVWYTSDNISLNQASNGPSPSVFNVNTGDYIFSIAFNNPTYSTSTVPPSNTHHSIGGVFNEVGADWTITSSNPIFNVISDIPEQIAAVYRTIITTTATGGRQVWEQELDDLTLASHKWHQRLIEANSFKTGEEIHRIAQELGSKGGMARAQSLTAKHRSDIATKAAQTRWQ